MPELPEVEVTRLGLMPLVNLKVSDVIIRNPSLRWPVNSKLPQILKNQVLKKIGRRGKYILAEFSEGTLICHLGMSGSIRIVSKKNLPKKHDHVDIIFKSNINNILRYIDPRRFGSIIWTSEEPSDHPLIKFLGPEPLTQEFNCDYLFNKLKRKKQVVKNSIMDSHLVVGVGNIYANEALFLSGIRPQRSSNLITKKESSLLVQKIKSVIKNAIKKGGSTLNDFYDVSGESGYFQNDHLVYGKEGASCVKCNHKIIKIKLGQRSSFYCSKCQK